MHSIKDMQKHSYFKEPILTIGTLAQMLNIHQRTLRIYDKKGILSPRRTSKNRRLYSIDDYTKAQVISFLTGNLALNLSGVKIVFALIKKNNIVVDDYLRYVKEIAGFAGFDEKLQRENLIKTSRRGRRKC